MKLIIALIASIIFYGVFSEKIKKKPVLFYVGTFLLNAFVISYYLLGWNKFVPPWVTTNIMDLFQRGAFSTATFIIVMFLGAVIKHNNFTLKYMKIRGELSIIGCLLALEHNIIYGVVYISALIFHPESISGAYLVSLIITIILLLIMLPLFITSFRCIRNKMKPKSWKKLQRMAYPFYYLIYAHVMVLFLANPQKHILDIVVYTSIYLIYTVVRLRKHIRNRRKIKNLN